MLLIDYTPATEYGRLLDDVGGVQARIEMLLRHTGIALLTILICAFSVPISAKTSKEKNGLIGPIRSVTTKAQGFSVAETYDHAGNLIEAVISGADGTSTRYAFIYDGEGNLQEEDAYDANGKIIYRKMFAYVRNSNEREAANVAASSDGKFLHAEFSTYDHRGALSEEIFVNETQAYRSVFNVLGQMIYSAWFDKGKLYSERLFRYDDNGRLTELTSYNHGGVITGRLLNEYDESGRCIRSQTEKFLSDEISRWVTTYQYDDTGNWIKELTRQDTGASSNGTQSSNIVVQERIIEYFETHR